jgi:hypothetical protein
MIKDNLIPLSRVIIRVSLCVAAFSFFSLILGMITGFNILHPLIAVAFGLISACTTEIGFVLWEKKEITWK